MKTKWFLIGVVLALLAILFYKYFVKIYDYWREQGVPYVKGAIPFFGNILPILLFRQTFGDFCNEAYNSHKGRSVVGFFQFSNPCLLIRDPEIVKTVLMSGFSNFRINVMSVDPTFDPLIARNPFFSNFDQWKTERSRLTVALMSRRKLKDLFGAVKNVCSKFGRYLEENVKTSKGTFETEGKNLFSYFTGEVVASAGFGAEGDFFSNGSGPNSFREKLAGMFDPSMLHEIEQTVLFTFPLVNKIMGLSFIPKKVDKFFRRVVSEMISMREKDGLARQDFLQILMDTQKAKGETINEFGITASATAFFLEGYETSALTLTLFAYQLAAHPNVQDKLRHEIQTVLEKYNGEVTYEALSEMTYMDQALNESMRINPAVLTLSKKCNERCNIVGSDGVEYLVEPGTVIVIPVRNLQTDPEYWDNPEVYDPERFTDENKKNRPKTVFLPFGDGPRVCVGMRFALLQIKAAITTMIRNYSIHVSPKTTLPVRVKTTPFLSTIEGELWIRCKPL